MNNRRKLVIAFGAGALVRPFGVIAQQPANLRIGWLSGDRADNSPFFEAFRRGMRELGYIEGRNLVIEARFSEGSTERLDQIAIELARLNPQIIVTQAGPATFAMVRVKPPMPVVFGVSGDPVEARLVESFARPGGNMTGASWLSADLVGKRMEILKEAMPGLKRVAIIANPEHPGEQLELGVSRAAAKSLGLAIDYHPVRNDKQLDDALAAALKSRNEAIVAFPDALVMRQSERIAAFSVKNRIPVISGWAGFAERGNIMTYGPNLRDSFYRLATYVDKIAKGAKPADLPVELPTTIELVVNMKTASAIGIKVPNSILVRADKVIE